MRKLLAAAAVAALATFGLAGRASAQAFYPKTPTNVPARVGGTYGYPSQYPTYPGQYSTASHKQRDRDDNARRDRVRDDDDRGWRNADRDHYDRGTNSRYGTSAGTRGVPSRVGGYNAAAQSRSTYGDHRDNRWGRDGR